MGRGEMGVRSAGDVFEKDGNEDVRAAVMPSYSCSPLSSVHCLPGVALSLSRKDSSPGPAVSAGAGACARAQSVPGVRGRPASARGPGGCPKGTHRVAGRAGRGPPGVQVAAAVECDVPGRLWGSSVSLGRARERQAGQEAGRPASECPHAPCHLWPLRPPARGPRGDT